MFAFIFNPERRVGLKNDSIHRELVYHRMTNNSSVFFPFLKIYFLKKLLLFYITCLVFCLLVYLCVCVQCLWKPKVGVRYPELELKMVVSHHEVAGN